MLEKTIMKITSDAVQKALNPAEKAIRKTWSILDAVSEKKRRGEYLRKNAIKSNQGKPPQG